MKVLKQLFIFILSFTSCFNFSCAQQSVLFLNGNTRTIKSYDVKGDYFIYSRLSDKPGRTRKIFLDRLYSVKDSILGERIIYTPDAADSLELTREEMLTFIRGEQYAMKHYRSTANGVAAGYVGAGAGLFGIYGLFTPFIYAGVSGAFSPRFPVNLPDAPPEINNDIFKEGYQYKAKKMKAKTALVFGGVGLAAGAGWFFAVIRPSRN